MSRIRVVHVIDDLGAGGAQRQLIELLRGADRTSFDHRVCSLSDGRDVRAHLLTDRGFPVEHIPQRGWLDLSAALRLLRYLKAQRADIVQTWLFTADLYGRIAARLVRAPLVVSSVRSTEPDKPRHYVWADRLLDRWTDRFIVNARSVGRTLVERENVDPSRIAVIYNGVDTNNFLRASDRAGTRAGWGWTSSNEVVGFVGRMRPEKRADLFVMAAAILHAKRPKARFLLVGGGPEQPAIDALIDRAGLRPVVSIIPFQLDVVPVFHALDVLVTPSDYEGCSNVILEAMASSVPVVATDVGGNRELVGDDHGWLVPPNEPAALADVIGQALNDLNARNMRAITAQGRVRELFSLERMVSEHEALYFELVARRSGGLPSRSANPANARSMRV